MVPKPVEEVNSLLGVDALDDFVLVVGHGDLGSQSIAIFVLIDFAVLRYLILLDAFKSSLSLLDSSFLRDS